VVLDVEIGVPQAVLQIVDTFLLYKELNEALVVGLEGSARFKHFLDNGLIFRLFTCSHIFQVSDHVLDNLDYRHNRETVDLDPL